MFCGFEVDFPTELRFLHDAGYNILTYDLRSHGLSSDGNGVTSGLGLIEARDVVGSLQYVRSREDLAAMKLGLYSRCMGANSTIVAMNFWPEEFDDVQAHGNPRQTSGSTPTRPAIHSASPDDAVKGWLTGRDAQALTCWSSGRHA